MRHSHLSRIAPAFLWLYVSMSAGFGQTTSTHNLTSPGQTQHPPAAQNQQAQNMPAAGTTVGVRMIDAIDSDRDPAGKQYRASVTQPVNSGHVTIAAGAAATVSLAKVQSGWVAQLTSLFIDGQTVAVTSGTATVSGNGAAQNTAKAVNSVLGGLGRRSNAPASVAAVASGARVMLPPGTTLSFVLAAMPSSTAAAPASDSQAHDGTQAAPAPAAPAPAAQSSRPGAIPMFCHAVTTQTAPPTAYVSQVIAWGPTADPTHDSTAAWTQFLAAKYPGVRFDSNVQCVGASVLGIQQDRSDYISQPNKMRNKFPVVQVDWQP